MPSHRLQLQPFAPGGHPAPTVTAGMAVARASARPPELRLEFQVVWSPDAELLVPAPVETPRRLDGLWEHTCLECFLAAPDQTAYWEVNLSPSGDWNVYRLDDYRQGLQPAPDYTTVPVDIRQGPGDLEVVLCCPLPDELQGVAALAWNLTAVLEAGDGSLSYWAPRHGPAAPDFHDRGLWMAWDQL